MLALKRGSFCDELIYGFDERIPIREVGGMRFLAEVGLSRQGGATQLRNRPILPPDKAEQNQEREGERNRD